MSKQNVVCSLSVYVSHKLPEFKQLLDNVCSTKLLSVSNKNGVAFITPDSKLVKRFLKISDDLMENNQLQEIRTFCRRHFILDSIHDKTVDSVINHEGKSLSVTKDKNGIILSDNKGRKTTIKKMDINFMTKKIKNEDVNPNIHIFEQTSDTSIHELDGVPVERNKPPHSKNEKPSKVKGGRILNVNPVEGVTSMDDIIRNLYSRNLKYVTKKGSVINSKVLKNFRNPYLSMVNSLFQFLKENDNDLFDILCLLKDVSPEVNFYMFIEPFNNNNSTRLISLEMMRKWGGTLFDYKINTYNYLLDSYSANIILNDNELKSLIVNSDNSNFYESLHRIIQNKYGGLVSLETLKWMDLFRHTFRNRFANLLHNIKHNGIDIGDMLHSIILEIYNSFSGTDKRIGNIVGMIDTEANSRLLSEMKESRSLGYLNCLNVYDYGTNRLIRVDSMKTVLKYVPLDKDNNFSYLLDGYDILNQIQ